jgi:hypothetical protein
VRSGLRCIRRLLLRSHTAAGFSNGLTTTTQGKAVSVFLAGMTSLPLDGAAPAGTRATLRATSDHNAPVAFGARGRHHKRASPHIR